GAQLATRCWCRQTKKVAFRCQVGEPGKWMVHCHVLGHQATGMMGYFAVT
ncbi:MAG: multicopper oxidase domain-containing protein, partial [Burkholderiaceae bacterium]